ncbi:MAG TPA: RNA pyrophosphohydrolase [Alphaproteobacteria bacterium]
MSTPPEPVRDTGDLAYRLGVGIMLLNPAGEVFVAKRIDTPGDAWQMPQGGIDADEAPRAAALRELEEEIGTANAVIIAESRDWYTYDLPPDLVGKVWGGRYRGQRQKWFAARFLGRDDEINLATAHPEFGAWKWVHLEDLPTLIVPFKRALYSAVVDEFRPLVTKR